MAPMVYVATPIDFNEGGDALVCWEIQRECKKRGWVTYTPAHAFQTNGAEPDPRVTRVHFKAMTQCDAIIAYLPERVPSIGVPMEIEQARAAAQIPVVVVEGYGSWALQRPGVHQVKTAEEGVAWLAERIEVVDRGPILQPLKVVAERHDMVPMKMHEGDAGFDLFVSKRTACPPGAFTDVPAGINIELPSGWWGLVMGRSSTLRKRGLLVNDAVIDNGWRGPMFSGVWNLGNSPVTLEVGERVAQLIPIRLGTNLMQPIEVDALGPGDRDQEGFGSTGA